MARPRNTYNRYSAPPDSAPSRLEELTLHSRLEDQERNAAGWRRNLAWASLALVAIAMVFYLVH